MQENSNKRILVIKKSQEKENVKQDAQMLAAKGEGNNVKIVKNKYVVFPSSGVQNNILVVGNFDGIFGNVGKCLKDGKTIYHFDNGLQLGDVNYRNTWGNNASVFLKNMRSENGKIVVASNENTSRYMVGAFRAMYETFMGKQLKKVDSRKFVGQRVHVEDTTKAFEKLSHKYKNEKDDVISNLVRKEIFSNIEEIKKKHDMKFDTIIMNPPYNGSLHLDFFENGLDLLAENGQLVIVEPATWLINVRKNGKAKRYDEIKKRIEGHVKSVVIENLNNDFGTTMFTPFSVTTVDMANTYDTIDFCCFGERKQVKSIYDCNLVGNYNIIHSIINKVGEFGDFMAKHTTKKTVKGNDVWYARYQNVAGQDSIGCGSITPRNGMNYDKDTLWTETKNGGFLRGYCGVLFHHHKNEISTKLVNTCDESGEVIEKIGDNIYGTKEELENWKWFVYNNKLPLFLNLTLIYDQNNTVKQYMPWLTDKQRTDEEINQMFGFTDEEISFMNKTIKKFERNSPWFRRYLCGYTEVTDEEVQNFCNNL